MKKILEIKEIHAREPITSDWLRYEITEDDFLLGKTPEFFPDIWEDEE